MIVQAPIVVVLVGVCIPPGCGGEKDQYLARICAATALFLPAGPPAAANRTDANEKSEQRAPECCIVGYSRAHPICCAMRSLYSSSRDAVSSSVTIPELAIAIRPPLHLRYLGTPRLRLTVIG